MNVSLEDFLVIRNNLVRALIAHNAELRSHFGVSESQGTESSRQISQTLCGQSSGTLNFKFELYRQRIDSIDFLIIEDIIWITSTRSGITAQNMKRCLVHQF